MKQINLVLVFLITCSSLAASTEEWFWGEFRPNIEETINHWKEERPFGQRTDRLIESHLEAQSIRGNFTLIITETDWSGSSDGKPANKYRYKIIKRTEDTVSVRITERLRDREVEYKLLKTQDGFWLYKGVSQILLKLLGGFPVVGLVFR